MMIDPQTRRHVRSLLDAVREDPTELPLPTLLELARLNVHVSIDREGAEPIVYVSPTPGAVFSQLSPREYEVATLLAAGASNREIADALFIAIGTVKDHVHSILAKTQLPSRAAVAAAWYGNASAEPA